MFINLYLRNLYSQLQYKDLTGEKVKLFCSLAVSMNILIGKTKYKTLVLECTPRTEILMNGNQ